MQTAVELQRDATARKGRGQLLLSSTPFMWWLSVFAAGSAIMLWLAPGLPHAMAIVAMLTLAAIALSLRVEAEGADEMTVEAARRGVARVAPAIFAGLLFIATSAAAHLVATYSGGVLVSSIVAAAGFLALVVLHTGLVFAAQFALAHAAGRHGDTAVAVYVGDGFAGLAGRLD